MVGVFAQTETIEQLATAMAGFSERAQASIRAIDQNNNRLHADWKGQAATAQLEAHQRIRRGLEQAHEAITALHKTTRQAHANYVETLTTDGHNWD